MFQPSLAGLIEWLMFTQDYRPGLLSTRPFGTQCRALTQCLKGSPFKVVKMLYHRNSAT
jgi:hypothetical protein